MQLSDYIEKGQVADFEIETGGNSPKYLIKVENVSETEIAVVVIDEPSGGMDIRPGTKGYLRKKQNTASASLYVTVEYVSDSSILHLKHIPSRTYVRVDAYLLFSSSKITEQQYLARRKKYIRTVAQEYDEHPCTETEPLKADTEALKSIPPHIQNELHSINKKLNFIIKIIGKPYEKCFMDKEPVEINISGAGVRFKSAEALNVGDYVEIEMLLPQGSGVIIDLIGKVVRCCGLQRRPGVADLYEVAAQYEAINGDDRESIIHYVLRRQRELLRAEEKESRDV
jgi:hypothetical protein